MRRQSSYPQFLIALILTTLCALTTHAQEAKVVDFPDKNLEAAIRKAINKPTGDILQTDLVGTGLTELRADSASITDLTGLEHCVDLKYLFLRGNQIRDLSALAGLTGLKQLGLGNNQISDVSALTGLDNLKVLLLGTNRISDISALASLTNLWQLELESNQISDITVLAGLPNLVGVGLEDNPIHGIRSWIMLARIECRMAWLAWGPVKVAAMAVGVTLFIWVVVILRLWARSVSKRYTKEP